MVQQELKWLSLHIYTNEPLESLIVNCLYPIIIELRNSSHLKKFFFIRYWEFGQHVRLRIQADSYKEKEAYRKRVQGQVQAYFKKYPNKILLPNISDTRKKVSANIVEVDYRQEINRYGGDSAIEIAEKQFMYSSVISMEFLSNNILNLSYELVLGEGMKMHIIFMYSQGLNKSEISIFFLQYCENWIHKLLQSSEKRSEEFMKIFESNFQKQKESISSFVENLFEILSMGYEFEEESLTSWRKESETISSDLNHITDQKLLQVPNWYEQRNSNDRQLWAIYDSYIHMTNNRLGIHNREEAFLAYLIHRSLEVITNGNRNNVSGIH